MQVHLGQVIHHQTHDKRNDENHDEMLLQAYERTDCMQHALPGYRMAFHAPMRVEEYHQYQDQRGKEARQGKKLDGVSRVMKV